MCASLVCLKLTASSYMDLLLPQDVLLLNSVIVPLTPLVVLVMFASTSLAVPLLVGLCHHSKFSSNAGLCNSTLRQWSSSQLIMFLYLF